MSDIIRIDANARRSRATVFENLIFLAGQVADDKTADIAVQTAQALNKIDALLTESGSNRSRLLSVQIWLASMTDFDAMNAVYDAWVVPGQQPTRCCGQVALADPAWRVEITAIAAR